MAASDIHPFRVDIPKAEVDRLKRKLDDTRLPPREIVPGAGEKYGMSLISFTLGPIFLSRVERHQEANKGRAILQLGLSPIPRMEDQLRLVQDSRRVKSSTAS